MSGLKPGLLNTDHTMQLLGCQLLAAAVHRAPAVLLQQLIAADACEHMFDVLRGTLSSCSMGASILALQQQQQQGPGGAVVVTEDLQAAALSALQCLSTQGEVCFSLAGGHKLNSAQAATLPTGHVCKHTVSASILPVSATCVLADSQPCRVLLLHTYLHVHCCTATCFPQQAPLSANTCTLASTP